MSGWVFRWAAPLFARGAKHWAETDARDFARRLAPYLAPNGRLLDLAGGTGALAGLMAQTVPCAVTVVDSSPNMLRRARDLPGVEPILGDAAALPFPDDTFDALLVCDAFHHFVEPEVAAREMARVVRPGGGVLVADYDAGLRGIRLVGAIERVFGEPGRFLRPFELEELMARAGVQGSTERRTDATYVFVGQVAPGPHAG